jgi:hypothetical protein
MKALPVKAGLWPNLLARLRRLRRELMCKHTHTFRLDLKDARWYSSGEVKCYHHSLALEGCYLCGQCWVRDTCA